MLESAVLLLIVAALGAGVSGAVASTWALRQRVLSLELEQETIKNDLVSEVKRRASYSRGKKDELDVLLEQMPKGQAPQNNVPWWARTQHIEKG